MTQVALILFQLALVIGIPALIAMRAPPRWRLWGLALWVLLPLLLGLTVGVSEIVSGKASAADIDKLIYGLLLIGSFLALPWLMACGVGYGIGVILRGSAKPKAPEIPTAPLPAASVQQQILPPVAYIPPPVDPDAPTLSPPGGWRAVHVGFDHDDLVLDGLRVWSLQWREEDSEPVMLAHPAHAAQRHAFRIYNVDDGLRAARFAAAELSNGVWGFYRWIVPADAISGTSADGSLGYEHDPGPFEGGRHDAVSPVARLHDVRTGALLFDGSAWGSSRIVPQTDGRLLLSLEQAERQTIFRIDPAAGSFRDLTASGATRPLAGLADAAAAARADCNDPANTYLGRCVAPDGSLLVELQAVEWSNTHWVRSPRVTEIATGHVLLDLWGTDWDAAISFPRSRTVRLSFRRYHFGGAADAEIDLDSQRYVIFGRSGATGGPLAGLPEALDDAAHIAAAQAGPRPVVAETRPTARNWLVALRILAGTLGLIAAATIITLRIQGEPPPQKLDTIPPMPGQQ